jgi:alkylhydroperoxidase family enzyme
VVPGEAPQAVAKRLQTLPDLNIFKLMAHAHNSFAARLRLGASLLADLSLDPDLRELAILRVAHLTPGAEYEWVQHEAIAREIGFTPERVDSARYAAASGGDDALVLSFTEQVVLQASPDDETFAACAERFSNRQIIELLMVIGPGHYRRRGWGLDSAAGHGQLTPPRPGLSHGYSRASAAGGPQSW